MNKLTILGSGTFFIDTIVTASSFLLEIDNKKILVDCGPGTLVKLAHAEVDITDLDYIFITHFHADHTSDLFPLFMNLSLTERFESNKIKKSPIIYGPEGIDKFMLDMSKLVEMDIYEGSKIIKSLDYTSEIVLDKIKIKPYKVEHAIFGQKARAYSLRFEFGENILAISGDTVDCPGIRDACKDATLFLCDTSFPNDMTNKAHMNTSDIGKICSDSNVEEVLLYHLYPQFTERDLIGEIKKFYDGNVRKVKDLEVINLK